MHKYILLSQLAVVAAIVLLLVCVCRSKCACKQARETYMYNTMDNAYFPENN